MHTQGRVEQIVMGDREEWGDLRHFTNTAQLAAGRSSNGGKLVIRSELIKSSNLV